MVMVPNSQPRGSGMVINNYFNCQGSGKDCDISVINVDDNCKNCGYDDWNFKLNVDNKRYNDSVMECFGKIKNNSLRNRLKELGKSFKGEIFFNYQHKERFYNFLQEENWETDDISSRFLAILFLLSADKNLWRNSEEILKKNRIDFKNICLKHIDTNAYALYQTAKTLSSGRECIRSNELADKELIEDMTFKAIINSALINRYGAELFLITK